MNTRAKNKTAHPGYADKPKTRRTRAEVEEDRKTKAEAKASREEAKQNGIIRMAEFEAADLAEEDLVDATPRPLFTPRQRSKRHNQAYSGLTPIQATSDIDTSDFDGALFNPAKSDISAENPTDEDSDSVVESDAAASPPKKLKSHNTRKATPVTTEATARRKKKQVDESEPEVEAMASHSQNEEPRRVPKVKKQAKKAAVREEINKVAQKIRESKYGDMVDTMSQGRKDAGSTSQTVVEKEAAISSIIAPHGFEKINSDQVSKRDKKET